MNTKNTLAALQKWETSLIKCPENAIWRNHAQGALNAKLPALATLLDIIQRCEGAKYISGSVMIAELTPLARILAGDTQARLRKVTGVDRLMLPILTSTVTEADALWG